MSENYIYITGTDYSVVDAQVASGYLFIDPYTNTSDYYTNEASAMSFTVSTFEQSLSGTTFSGDELVYKRTTTITVPENVYSEFSTINYVLSGINDESNPIIKIIFEPVPNVFQTVNYANVTDYNINTPYLFAVGQSSLNNPKNSVYSYNYDLSANEADIKSYTSKFSAYRCDGLVDEYIVNINIGRDSIYNVADKIKLLEAQILPLSTYDPMLKVELEAPNHVNHIVLKRDVTPTPTRTLTYTPTPNASATITYTPTRTQTRSTTPVPTVSYTLTQTPTVTPTQTQTPTKSTGVTPSRTKTQTPSQTSRNYAGVTPPPTPSPSLSSECKSKIYTISYTGRNNVVDPSTVYVGLKYNYSPTIKSLYAKQITTVVGTNTIDINVPVSSTDDQLEFYVYFTADDPGITFNSMTLTTSCGSDSVDRFVPGIIPDPDEPGEPILGDPPQVIDPVMQTTIPQYESVFQFGLAKEFIPDPIVVNLPFEEATTTYPELPMLYEVGESQVTRVTIIWTTFKSTRGIDDISNDVDASGYPNNVVQTANGSRSYVAAGVLDDDIYIGAPVLSTEFVRENGINNYIWFKVITENIPDDFNYYQDTWVPSQQLYPNEYIGWEYRLQKLNDPAKDPEFANLTYIPRCQFPGYTKSYIFKMIDLQKWYDQNKPITFKITNS